MDKASARQKAIDHLTTVVADCNDALGANDIWADYSPKDRARSLALFQETRDVASRVLANLKANDPVSRADWKRIMPPGTEWSDVFKAIAAETQET